MDNNSDNSNVTPFVAPQRPRAFPGPAEPDNDTGGPVNNVTEFEIAWEMPGGAVEVQDFQGAIVATSVFVGIADEDGFLQFIVPLSRLLYVRPLEEIEVDQVA